MSERDPSRRVVVITGIGAIGPAGNNVDEIWQRAVDGNRDGVITNQRELMLKKLPEAYRKNFRSHLGAKINDLNVPKHPAYEGRLDDRDIERYYSPSAEVAAIAVAEALADANAVDSNWEITAAEPERRGVSFGTGIGGAILMADYYAEMVKGEKMPTTGLSRCQPENAAMMMALRYRLRATLINETAACASGNKGIIRGAEAIRDGKADFMIAGGVEGFHPLIVAMFERTRAADTGEDPETASRPFHNQASGAIGSEGAGILILEELEKARARNARIYAIFAGAAESSDASDPTLMDPERVEATMREALDNSGVIEEDYVHGNAHATATPRGDPGERDAFLKVFDGRTRYHKDQIKHRVWAPKSLEGHGLGAANGIEAVMSTKVLDTQTFPRSFWLADREVIPGMEDLITDPFESKVLPVTVVLSNGMGFAGQNASIVLMRYEEYMRRTEL